MIGLGLAAPCTGGGEPTVPAERRRRRTGPTAPAAATGRGAASRSARPWPARAGHLRAGRRRTGRQGGGCRRGHDQWRDRGRDRALCLASEPVPRAVPAWASRPGPAATRARAGRGGAAGAGAARRRPPAGVGLGVVAGAVAGAAAAPCRGHARRRHCSAAAATWCAQAPTADRPCAASEPQAGLDRGLQDDVRGRVGRWGTGTGRPSRRRRGPPTPAAVGRPRRRRRAAAARASARCRVPAARRPAPPDPPEPPDPPGSLLATTTAGRLDRRRALAEAETAPGTRPAISPAVTRPRVASAPALSSARTAVATPVALPASGGGARRAPAGCRCASWCALLARRSRAVMTTPLYVSERTGHRPDPVKNRTGCNAGMPDLDHLRLQLPRHAAAAACPTPTRRERSSGGSARAHPRPGRSSGWNAVAVPLSSSSVTAAKGVDAHDRRDRAAAERAGRVGRAGHGLPGLGLDLPGDPGRRRDRPAAAGDGRPLPARRPAARRGDRGAQGSARAAGPSAPARSGGDRRAPAAARRQRRRRGGRADGAVGDRGAARGGDPAVAGLPALRRAGPAGSR